jgi:hypothetical protein
MSDWRTVAMPDRVARLPRDRRGIPIPWFVQWIAGEPEFRVMNTGNLALALRESRCWVCGGKLGALRAYVIGPMCAVNRTSAEPPNHRDCAEYSAQVCPFLTTPGRPRRARGLPDVVEGPGIALKRNPGVAGVWITRGTQTKPDGHGGLLFHIGDPVETLWFAQGRPATRDEVLASIESGLPALRELAEAEGPRAVRQLECMTAAALQFVPRSDSAASDEGEEPEPPACADLADELEVREFGPVRRAT